MSSNNKLLKFNAKRGAENFEAGVKGKGVTWEKRTLAAKPAYENWLSMLEGEYFNAEFITNYLSESDPWERAKMVAEQTRRASAKHREASYSEKAEAALAKASSAVSKAEEEAEKVVAQLG